MEVRRCGPARGLLFPAPGQHYKTIQKTAEERRGFADLAFYTIEELKERAGIYSAMRENGLLHTERAAELVNFYPHGRQTEGLEKQLFRRGVGGALFEVILRDCMEGRVSAIFAHATSIEMQSFLEKRFFRQISANSKFYYTLINSAVSLEDNSLPLLFSARRKTA